jgi:CRP-like cAMP-binding protein
MVNNNVKPSVTLLREINLLRSFTDEELGRLIHVGQAASYEAHSNVVIEGELSWGLYLILDGIVGVFKTNKLKGDMHQIAQLRSGSFIGEMSLVDDSPRSATVQVLTDCQLFYISKESFNKFLDQSPGLKMRFFESCIQDLVKRLREIGDDYVISQYQLWKTAISQKEAS